MLEASAAPTDWRQAMQEMDRRMSEYVLGDKVVDVYTGTVLTVTSCTRFNVICATPSGRIKRYTKADIVRA